MLSSIILTVMTIGQVGGICLEPTHEIFACVLMSDELKQNLRTVLQGSMLFLVSCLVYLSIHIISPPLPCCCLTVSPILLMVLEVPTSTSLSSVFLLLFLSIEQGEELERFPITHASFGS